MEHLLLRNKRKVPHQTHKKRSVSYTSIKQDNTNDEISQSQHNEVSQLVNSMITTNDFPRKLVHSNVGKNHSDSEIYTLQQNEVDPIEERQSTPKMNRSESTKSVKMKLSEKVKLDQSSLFARTKSLKNVVSFLSGNKEKDKDKEKEKEKEKDKKKSKSKPTKNKSSSSLQEVFKKDEFDLHDSKKENGNIINLIEVEKELVILNKSFINEQYYFLINDAEENFDLSDDELRLSDNDNEPKFSQIRSRVVSSKDLRKDNFGLKYSESRLNRNTIAPGTIAPLDNQVRQEFEAKKHEFISLYESGSLLRTIYQRNDFSDKSYTPAIEKTFSRTRSMSVLGKDDNISFSKPLSPSISTDFNLMDEIDDEIDMDIDDEQSVQLIEKWKQSNELKKAMAIPKLTYQNIELFVNNINYTNPIRLTPRKNKTVM